MRQEDFEIFSKSKDQCFRAQHLFCDQTFPVYIALVRGHDLIMRSETIWVKVLNHQFLSYWAPPHFLVVVFQFCETAYRRTPHQ